VAKLKHLFDSIKIGEMVVKNRIIMPAMGINFGCDSNGSLTEQMRDYMGARAKGGTGMMIIGGGAIHETGVDLQSCPRLWLDEVIPSLKMVTDKVHNYGTKIGMHLYHSGGQADHERRVAPSPIAPLAIIKGIPRALSLEEIRMFITLYGESAKRCREGGFDFVEIHGSHGYLISEFLSPHFNKRTDAYGGSFQNRIRFLLECIESIKKIAGSDFPVGVRINGDDFLKGGWQLDDAKKLAPLLKDKGADYLSISGGIYGTAPLTIASMYEKKGYLVYLAEEIKKVVSIPVVAVGRIKDPIYADEIIKNGKADIVAIGRALIADPDFANKAERGDLNDIRPCLGCCLGCIENVWKNQEASCVMNPEVGREHILKEVKKVEIAKSILVVGAGPAGLAVARMASLRGHRVIIIDEKGYQGGLLKYASIPPKRQEIGGLVDYYQRQLNNLKVEIRLNTSLSKRLIDELNPDVGIICTGSLPKIPGLEGLFDTEMDLHTHLDVLDGSENTGDKVIILGGSQIALQTADFIAVMGKEVVVLNRDKHFAPQMAANDRFYLRERLKVPNIKLYKNVIIQEILPYGIVFASKNKKIKLDGYKDIIIAEGMQAIRKPMDLFKDKEIEIHVIGDSKDPRTILETQAEADELGRTI